MESYRKQSEIEYVKAKTELELVLIFIIQLGFITDFYSFIEKFEYGMFLQYLDNIKNLFIEQSNYSEERQEITRRE